MLQPALGHAILSPQADTVGFESSLTHLRLPSPQLRLDSDDSDPGAGCNSSLSPPTTMVSGTLASIGSTQSDADFDFHLSLGSVWSSDMDLTHNDSSICAREADSAPVRRRSMRKGNKRSRSTVRVAERAKQNEDAIVQDYLHTFSSSPPPTDDDSVAAILSTTNSVTCCLCGQPSDVCSGLFAHLSTADEDRYYQTTAGQATTQPIKHHPCDIEGSSISSGDQVRRDTTSAISSVPVASSIDQASLETDRYTHIDACNFVKESDLESPEWMTDCLLQELKTVVDNIDSGLLTALPPTSASNESLSGLLQQAVDDSMATNELHDDWKAIAPQCRNGHSGARNWCRPLEQYWYDLCGDANCEACMDAFFMGTEGDEVPGRIAPVKEPLPANDDQVGNDTQGSDLQIREETVQTISPPMDRPTAAAESTAHQHSSQNCFTAKLEATKKKRRKVLGERSNNTTVRRRSSSHKVGSARKEVCLPGHSKQHPDRLCVSTISASSSSSSLVSMDASPTPATKGTHFQRNSVVLTNSRRTMTLTTAKSTHRERHLRSPFPG